MFRNGFIGVGSEIKISFYIIHADVAASRRLSGMCLLRKPLIFSLCHTKRVIFYRSIHLSGAQQISALDSYVPTEVLTAIKASKLAQTFQNAFTNITDLFSKNLTSGPMNKRTYRISQNKRRPLFYANNYAQVQSRLHAVILMYSSSFASLFQ